MAYAKDDRHLHLVGVGEEKLVVSNTPDLLDDEHNNQLHTRIKMCTCRLRLSYRVKSKRIWVVRCHSFSRKPRSVALRTTKDHTIGTRTATPSNSSARGRGRERESGEREREERERERRERESIRHVNGKILMYMQCRIFCIIYIPYTNL